MAKDGGASPQSHAKKDVMSAAQPKVKKSSGAAPWRRKRFSVFAAYLLTCVAIVLLYDPCDVREKKQNCGYKGLGNGISSLECRTVACFAKGGGVLEKRMITIKRKKGTRWGMHVNPDGEDDSWFFIRALDEGPVAEHNAQLPEGSDDRIFPKDVIASVDGASGKRLPAALSSTASESAVFEIRRSKLPSSLLWMHGSARPGIVERVLTSPGFKSWVTLSSQFGGYSFFMWLMSGYSPASLPFFYFAPSGFVGWHIMRCCHDPAVGPGVPHCYKGRDRDFMDVFEKIRQRALDSFSEVGKDPSSYLKWLADGSTQLYQTIAS